MNTLVAFFHCLLLSCTMRRVAQFCCPLLSLLACGSDSLKREGSYIHVGTRHAIQLEWESNAHKPRLSLLQQQSRMCVCMCLNGTKGGGELVGSLHCLHAPRALLMTE